MLDYMRGQQDAKNGVSWISNSHESYAYKFGYGAELSKPTDDSSSPASNTTGGDGVVFVLFIVAALLAGVFHWAVHSEKPEQQRITYVFPPHGSTFQQVQQRAPATAHPLLRTYPSAVRVVRTFYVNESFYIPNHPNKISHVRYSRSLALNLYPDQLGKCGNASGPHPGFYCVFGRYRTPVLIPIDDVAPL